MYSLSDSVKSKSEIEVVRPFYSGKPQSASLN